MYVCAVVVYRAFRSVSLKYEERGTMIEHRTSVARLHVHLLGAFAATVDGEGLATPPTGVQGLLGALLRVPPPGGVYAWRACSSPRCPNGVLGSG